MIVIYHSRDLDGYASGAICKKKFPEAKLIGYDYGQPIPWESIPKGEPVIMVDVSLKMDDMVRLAEHSGELTWIDHHASAIKDFNEYAWPPEVFINPVLKDGFAACEGAWNYLFMEPMPYAVSLLGKYDTWRNSIPSEWDGIILPFQFGMRLNISKAEDFPQFLLTPAATTYCPEIESIMQAGRVILQYQKQQNIIACRGAFEIDFMGCVAICVNAGGFNSQAFDSVYDPSKHDLMMPFKFDGKKWTFSLYTTKEDVDCSALAKKMGGGGHVKAAGFQVVGSFPGFLFNQDYSSII